MLFVTVEAIFKLPLLNLMSPFVIFHLFLLHSQQLTEFLVVVMQLLDLAVLLRQLLGQFDYSMSQGLLLPI